MRTGTQDIAGEVKSRLRNLTIIVVIMCVVIGGGGAYAFFVASEIKNAACALRADDENRLEQGQNFLVEHPKGTPGIPASVIRVSIQNETKTVHSLRGLNCS
jgi:flagellar basal body-associated protein FliL